MGKLKVGIIGTGLITGIARAHVKAYENCDRAALVALYDIVPGKAQIFHDKWSLGDEVKVCRTLDEFYSLVDAVSVCTPNHMHVPVAIDALSHGKHVLVEKPLSSEVEEAREMVALADATGCYLGCNLNHFFTPPAEKAKQYQQEGKLGELIFCLCKMGFQGGEVANYQAPGSIKVRDFPYFHMKAFMSHPLSVMRHFCGEATHVQAFMNRPGFRRTAGDPLLSTCSIHLRYANDCVGYLLSQRGDATYGLGGWWSCEVGGTKGTVCIENCIEKVSYWPAPDGRGPGKPAILPADDPRAPIVTESGTHDFSQTFNNRIHAFLEDVSNGVPKHELRASGRDALAVLELTFAAIESYENGGALVRPNPLPPLQVRPEELAE